MGIPLPIRINNSLYINYLLSNRSYTISNMKRQYSNVNAFKNGF